jgi:hypothetical protein
MILKKKKSEFKFLLQDPEAFTIALSRSSRGLTASQADIGQLAQPEVNAPPSIRRAGPGWGDAAGWERLDLSIPSGAFRPHTCSPLLREPRIRHKAKQDW